MTHGTRNHYSAFSPTMWMRIPHGKAAMKIDSLLSRETKLSKVTVEPTVPFKNQNLTSVT